MNTKANVNSNQPKLEPADRFSQLVQREQELESRIAQHNQQRKQWDFERARTLADIQQQSTLLKDAWLRLENAQQNTSNTTKPTSTQPQPAYRQQSSFTDTPLSLPEVDQTQPAACSPSPVEQFQLLQQHVFATDANAQKNNGRPRAPGELS